jgi:hypothetical protein
MPVRELLLKQEPLPSFLCLLRYSWLHRSAYGNPNVSLKSFHFSGLSAELFDPCQMEVPGCASSIKPKVETCEEEEPPLPPFEASDDWEVTPLSGDNPFFTSVMCKSQVQVPFQQVHITSYSRTHAGHGVGE